MLSVSPTAPPSLVECKHWGRRTRPQAISGGATAFEFWVYPTPAVLLLISAGSVLVVVRREGAGDAAGLVGIIDGGLVRDVVLAAVVHGDLGVSTGTQHVWDKQTRTAVMQNDVKKNKPKNQHAKDMAMAQMSPHMQGCRVQILTTVTSVF